MLNDTIDLLHSLPNEEQIEQIVGSIYFQRGKLYQQQNRVLTCEIDSEYNEIVSTVKGSGYLVYKVTIALDSNDTHWNIMNDCTCPIGYNCKHVAATLLHVAKQAKKKRLVIDAETFNPSVGCNEVLNNWFEQLTSDTKGLEISEKKQSLDYTLVYRLELCMRYSSLPLLKVSLSLCRELKKGGLGKPRKYSHSAISHQKYLSEEDKKFVFKLAYKAEQGYISYDYDNGYIFKGDEGSQLLKEIISTGKSFWINYEQQPILLGKIKTLDFQWVENSECSQKLSHNLAQHIKFIPVDPFWYYDEAANECGLLQSPFSHTLITGLVTAPILPPEGVNQAIKQLALLDKQFFSTNKKQISKINLPKPKDFGNPVREDIQQPIPCLRLKGIKVSHFIGIGLRYYHNDVHEVAAVELGFYYQQRFVPKHAQDRCIYYVDKQQIKFSPRQFVFENQMAQDLNSYDKLLDKLVGSGLDVLEPADQYVWIIGLVIDHEYIASEESKVMHFLFNVLPTLKVKGWQVEIDPTFPCNYIDEETVDWYADIEETEYDWFGFKLGIKVDGENINILPLLVDLLTHHHFREKNAFSSDEKFTIKLPDGRLLPIPAQRVKGIINVLTELFEENILDENGAVKLSCMRASQLLELNAAMGAARMRWIGGQRLITLGEKLKKFDGLKIVVVPKNFNATLRSYQQDGVNWLQFLREYNLSGILADDMGLGKTVQALAHLVIEKSKKRANLPSLIVMPTSLITNWQLETKRFAPILNVVKLHGNDRHQYFETLDQYDLILTTYPLLIRDKIKLCQQEFYLLILDEAQMIKNPKAQSTQIVHQLKAKHRLCMTGTPMENHLGELWTLMHFLMPGFLGNADQFRRLFRTPIEKNNDDERRIVLASRIKPFLLRRQKQDVLNDLPEKTEMIQHIELASAQRDLYESIRVAMHKKVTQAIQSKGLSKSHIIILDALLKLRQVCCDPRLIKLKAAEKAYPFSAKLAMLMEILPNMVEQGRRVLLFSQFTSMISLIEDELIKQKLSYVKLTGQTTNRKKPIMCFQNCEVPIFLISLKAGGTGLNLTAADTVIHYDPWWNPAVEDQATDRAHRIGQDKAVFIYKFIAKNTVEETILEMQKKKRNLISGLFSAQGNTKFRLSNKDLELLFQPLD